MLRSTTSASRVSRRAARARLRLLIALPLFWVVSAPGLTSDAGLWLLVDTGGQTLTVMRGGDPVETLANIAIGRYGASRTKRRGDNTTPKGRFRVTRVNQDSDFYRFIGLDYPDVPRARQAHEAGEIGSTALQRILRAHARGESPPQDTALGGHIGIHGLGRGDPRVHETMNWTRGCVALTDRQMDTLLRWVGTGMTVEIR
jgi:murein L,D-transpeptidase YafK